MPGIGVTFTPPYSSIVPSVIKPVNQTGSGATPQLDNDLRFDTEANSLYEIELNVIGGSSNTNDNRYFFVHTGDTTRFLASSQRGSNAHSTTTTSAGSAVAHVIHEGTMAVVSGHTGQSGDISGIHVKAFLATGATPGEFQLWWHLNGSGTPTIYAGSCMRVRKLSTDQVAWKTGDTTRTGTATMTADPDLTFDLDANTTYYVRIGFRCQSGATNDFKYSLAYSGTMDFANIYAVSRVDDRPENDNLTVGNGASFGITFTETTIAASTAAPIAGAGVATSHAGSFMKGLLRTVNAGTLSVIWSQNTSGGDNATMFAGSYLEVIPITELEETVIVKESTESRINTTTQADDTDIVVSLEAGKQYLITMNVLWNADVTPDAKNSLRVTGSPTAFIGCGPIRGAAAQTSVATGFSPTTMAAPVFTTPIVFAQAGAGGTNRGIWETNIGCIMAGSAGQFSFYWAQNTLHATLATEVFRGSYLTWQEVE